MTEPTGSGSGSGAAPDGDGLRGVDLSVPEMDCPSCARTVERALTRAGAAEVETRPTAGRLRARFDPATTDEAGLRRALEAAGYPAADGNREDDAGATSARALATSRRGVATAVGGVFLLAGLAIRWGPAADPTLGSVGGRTVGPAAAAYLASVAAAGPPILRAGLAALRARTLGMDVLMSAGMVGAIAIGHPFEAATLAVLFSTAELLERFSVERARGSVRELLALSPDVATVRRDGAEETVPADEVRVGDRVLVRPGDRIPVDGTVREGGSAVDESPITGESVPVEKAAGDEVYAGSVAEEGYLEVEATATAGRSTLARLVAEVESAATGETGVERFVDRFAGVYTPVVVAAAVATAVVPPLFGGALSTWLPRGLALLVIGCPCAFVIATPITVVSGVTAAARNGVLIKGGEHLEAAGSARTVAVDKTGTLTTGELDVTDVVPFAGAADDLLARAGAIESRSEHPIAAAIAAAARDAADDGTGTAGDADALDRDGTAVSGFEALPGEGVRAEIDGVTHYVGAPALLADRGFDLDLDPDLDSDPDLGSGPGAGGGGGPAATDGGRTRGGAAEPTGRGAAAGSAGGSAAADGSPVAGESPGETVARLQAAGKTTVLVATEERLLGAIAVADTVRPEAGWAVERLRALDVERVVMVTGDNARTARAVGDAVGIDDVRAGLLPDEKVAAVRELREDGGVVMVGDGINDAPALAAATVGVAMGAAGTDAAVETADAALMGDDLTRLPYLYDLSRRAGRIIRGNVAVALGVKALLAVGAPLGYVTIALAVLVGDMGMSLGVTGNALRLAGVEPAEPDD